MTSRPSIATLPIGVCSRTVHPRTRVGSHALGQLRKWSCLNSVQDAGHTTERPTLCRGYPLLCFLTACDRFEAAQQDSLPVVEARRMQQGARSVTGTDQHSLVLCGHRMKCCRCARIHPVY